MSQQQAVQVSCVVAAWNEERKLGAFLAGFESLALPGCELVLVAGGSDDSYHQARKRAAGIATVLKQEPEDRKAGALRKGLRAARGQWAYLTDIDCHFCAETVIALLKAVQRGNAAAATGRSLPVKEQLGIPFVRAHAAHLERRMAKIPADDAGFLIGANCLIARPMATESLKQDPLPAIGEDFWLFQQLRRLGGTISYVHESIVRTEFPASVPAYVRQRSRWYRGHLVHRFRAGDIAWLKDATLMLLCLAMLVLPPLLLVLNPWAAPLLLLPWVFALVSYALTWRWNRRNDPVNSLSLWPFVQLMLADVIALALALPQSLIRGWRERW